MQQPSGDSLPTFRISTDSMTGPDALTAFGQSVQDVFSLTCLGDPECYRLDVAAWHLGTIMVGWFRSSALAFDRDAALAAASGLDHLLVQLYVGGGFTGSAADRSVTVRAGDIVIFDLIHGLRTRASDFSNISVLVPRAFFAPTLQDISRLHGLVLPADNPLAAMLGSYMTSLVDRLPSLGVADGQLAARSTVALVTTMLAGQAPGLPPVMGITPSPFQRVSREIDRRLGDARLDPASLACDLAMSRATLYRTFQPVGGIADHIRRRRLAVAAIALSDPGNRRRKVGEIALDCGFATESAFGRAFKKAFGISPGKARQRSLDFWYAPDARDHGDASLDFARWMRMLHS
ncbi:helix-turn-helix domain-containing protein [Sphingobium lactosutens]|uniref:HTH araC/xylS-type domain-containing protein n=1 Tax=Sphingobium lactosutens DS20 TaxID=1331060 RepID=T0J8W6_9SPHN|nr:helix-turn-helix domain-containing protein [Sphingobium lactosutens]EQB18339.1 hypothetical protein RLDS_02725 [Sphingobium lactosutens DS20]